MNPVIVKYKKYLEDIINLKQLPPNVLYSDIKHELDYFKDIKAVHTYHNGQRKLFLTELEFLTIYHTYGKYFIYAGSAPGWKTFYLSTLFPNLIFILVDPNPFELLIYRDQSHKSRPNDPLKPDLKYIKYLDHNTPTKWVEQIKARDDKTKIFLINDYFTNITASELSELDGGIIFNSDIRTSDNDESPSDLDILWNSAQQLNWISLLKVKAYMLKFRAPYHTNNKTFPLHYMKDDFDFSKKSLGVDFISEYNSNKGTFSYLNGTIYLQAWAGYKSTETRLIGTYKDLIVTNYKIALKPYDIIEFESKLFYYNTIVRMYGFYFNDNANKTLGFDHCHDCALENKIWTNYGKSVIIIDIKQAVKTLNELTRRNLFQKAVHAPINHGFMFNPDRAWYDERLKYTAQVDPQLRIPDRNFKPADIDYYTYEMMIDNITGLMTQSDKKIYLDMFYKTRAKKSGPPPLEFKDFKEKIPFNKYIAFRSCFGDSRPYSFCALLHILTHNKYKYILIDDDPEEVCPSRPLAEILIKMFNVIVIILGVEHKPGMIVIPDKPGYYTTSTRVRELPESKEIADYGLLYSRGKYFLSICQLYAVLHAKMYNDVVMTNVKSYFISLNCALDSWCVDRVDFSHAEIVLAKSNGYDMKEFLKSGKYLFPNGRLYNFPFGAVSFNTYLVHGDKKNMKLVNYDLKDMSEKAYYKNNFMRNFQTFDNKYAMSDYGFDHCMDCAILAMLLERYAIINNLSDIEEFVQSTVKKVHGKSLWIRGHGNLLDSSDSSILNAFKEELFTRHALRTKM